MSSSPFDRDDTTVNLNLRDLIDHARAAERARCIEIVRNLGRTHYGTANAELIVRAIGPGATTPGDSDAVD